LAAALYNCIKRGEKVLHGGHQEAEKYNPSSSFPCSSCLVGFDVVLALRNNFSPRRDSIVNTFFSPPPSSGDDDDADGVVDDMVSRYFILYYSIVYYNIVYTSCLMGSSFVVIIY
jgi:hypothetical protein